MQTADRQKPEFTGPSKIRTSAMTGGYYRTSSPVTALPMIMRWISDVPSKIVKILVPAMRCRPQHLPKYGLELTELRASVPGKVPAQASGQAVTLLALESHAMFNAALTLGVPELRRRFGPYGRGASGHRRRRLDDRHHR